MKTKPQPEPTPTKEETANVTFQCPVSVRAEIWEIAIKQERSLAQQIVWALRGWLRSQSPSGSGGGEARGH